MRRYLIAVLIGTLLAAPALGFDAQLATNYEKFFSTFDEKAVPKALQRITPEMLVGAVNQGQEIVVIDVRTEAEMKFMGTTLPNSMSLPMNQVFKPENLQRIPTDKMVVVTCHKGLRATIIALALRNIGFTNVKALKGGSLALFGYLNPKTAHFAPPPTKK